MDYTKFSSPVAGYVVVPFFCGTKVEVLNHGGVIGRVHRKAQDPLKILATRGEQYRVEFPDGTRAWVGMPKVRML